MPTECPLVMPGPQFAHSQVQDRITGIMVAASAHYIMLGLIACFALSHTAGARMW